MNSSLSIYLSPQAQNILAVLQELADGAIEASASWTDIATAAHCGRTYVAAALRELKATRAIRQAKRFGAKACYSFPAVTAPTPTRAPATLAVPESPPPETPHERGAQEREPQVCGPQECSVPISSAAASDAPVSDTPVPGPQECGAPAQGNARTADGCDSREFHSQSAAEVRTTRSAALSAASAAEGASVDTEIERLRTLLSELGIGDPVRSELARLLAPRTGCEIDIRRIYERTCEEWRSGKVRKLVGMTVIRLRDLAQGLPLNSERDCQVAAASPARPAAADRPRSRGSFETSRYKPTGYRRAYA